MTAQIEHDRAIEILLVENNSRDVDLVRAGLEHGKVRNNLHVASDGEQALAFLRRRGFHADAPRPDIIFLELNLPRKDGRQVLAEIKADEALRDIPVVILTDSRDEDDIRTSYQHRADGYLIKPIHRAHFLRVVRNAEQFWLVLAAQGPADL